LLVRIAKLLEHQPWSGGLASPRDISFHADMLVRSIAYLSVFSSVLRRTKRSGRQAPAPRVLKSWLARGCEPDLGGDLDRRTETPLQRPRPNMHQDFITEHSEGLNWIKRASGNAQAATGVPERASLSADVSGPYNTEFPVR